MKTIVDYYGTEITVEPLMGSVGPVVDIELQGLQLVSALDPSNSWLRLELRDAVRLAEAILEAVEAPR